MTATDNIAPMTQDAQAQIPQDDPWSTLVTEHAGRGTLTLIHGQPKVGKSTLGAMADRPIFLSTENGLGRTDALRRVPAFLIKDCQGLLDKLDLLLRSPDRFQTAVIDSIDHAEHRMGEYVASLHGVTSIDAIGFNKGPNFLADFAKVHFMPRIRWLQDAGKDVMLIAHSDAINASTPDNMASFKRWAPKLRKPFLELLMEDADVIGFATQPILTAEQKGAFGKTKGVGVGDRRLYVQPGGGYLAGSRFDTAGREYVNLEWSELKAILKGTITPVS